MALRADIPEWLRLGRRLRPRRILDLGCGGGRVDAALLASEAARDVVGVDLVDVLRRSAGPRYALGDMRALPFAARTFDLVVAANDPFAHLLDDVYRLGWRVRPAEELELLAEDGPPHLERYRAAARAKIDDHEREDTFLPETSRA